jgi:hypothetical protein
MGHESVRSCTQFERPLGLAAKVAEDLGLPED